MEIKGKIGEEVFVKARIESIFVDEHGTSYCVLLSGKDGDFQNNYQNVKLEDVIFTEPKKPEKKAPEVKKDVEPIAPPKKRGRPRKTTVDDLVKKAKM